MNAILELLGTHHRHCDASFAAVEHAVEAGDWTSAAATFGLFRAAMDKHFEAEEGVLFPAFEARTGMTMGPTAVMRSEHAQIKELMAAAAEAIAARDADDYLGYAETMHIMIQQHNMKEENVLYPMCDQHLSDQAAALAAQMSPGLAD